MIKLRVGLTLLLSGMITIASTQSLKSISDDLVPFITRFEGSQVKNKILLPLKDGETVKTDEGAEWSLSVHTQNVPDDPNATDYELTWKLEKGNSKSVSVGIDFTFRNWSVDNYVFVPAIVYDGNRFEVKNIDYPPYWYEKNEWRKDMPTTTTVQPTLGKKGSGAAKIELTTGNATTPLMAFYDPNKSLGWMVQTTQGNSNGNHGLTIAENGTKTESVFSITSPAVREKRAVGSGFAESGDKAANYRQGDAVSIRFRTYTFPAKSLNDLYRNFLKVRKGYNPVNRKEELPFSEAWKLVNNLYQTERWDEDIDMYWLSKVGANASWNFIWQLGWCGGGQNTLPIMMKGGEQGTERAKKNIEVIISKSQARSGFFNAYGDGKEFVSFGFGSPLKTMNHWFVRRGTGSIWRYDSLIIWNREEKQFRHIGSRPYRDWRMLL